MAELKATLIICEHADNFRALKEIEGSDSRYIAGSRETSKAVKIRPANDDLLKKELADLSIIIDDVPTIRKVANKFIKELVTKKDGKLAFDECTYKGLFEIVE